MTCISRALLVVVTLSSAVLLAGCVPTPRAVPSATAMTEALCGQAETAKDCGGMGKLVKLARREGTVVVAADRESTPQLTEIAKRFQDAYQVRVHWVMAGQTSDERFAVLGAPGYSGPQPDVFALDPGSKPAPAAQVAAYRIVDFEKRIPSDHRDSNGRWADDFGGVVAVGYNASALGKQADARFLGKRLPVGAVAFAGSPRSSNNVLYAAAMLNAVSGSSGDLAGQKFLSGQKISPVPASSDQVESETQTVVLDWSYRQADLKASLRKSKVDWRTIVPSGAAVVGWHGVAINVRAPHPAAARLWEEFLFSSAIQNYLLDNGAMPTTYGAMLLSGEVNLKARRKMPVFSTAPIVPSATEIDKLRAAWSPTWLAFLRAG